MAFFKAQKMKINGKFYPTAVLVDRPMEIDEIASQISEASTVAKADVVAVLASLPAVMARGMNAGRSVHLQDVGHFRFTAAARKGGCDTAKEVSASDIVRTRVRFTPETRFGGDTATRALAPGSVHWTRFDGQPQAAPAEPEGDSGSDGDQDESLG